MFSREVRPWKLLAGPGASDDLVQAASLAARELEYLPLAASTSHRVLKGHGGAQWTPFYLDEGLPSQTLVLLPGDWSTGPASSWLPRLAETASIALRLSAARRAARTHAGIAASAYGFARRLSQLSGERALHQFIVDATARAANARLAGLSVYQPKEARDHRCRDLRIPERARRSRTHRAWLRHHRRGVFLEETAARYATPRACRD